MKVEQSTVDYPVAKGVSAGGVLAAGMTLGDWALVLSIFYTLLLIGDFFWKKCIRDWCVDRGWIKRRNRRQDD